MNNFELHEAALDLSCGQSAYVLARQLIEAQERITKPGGTMANTLKIYLDHPNAKVPTRGTEHSAGLDLYAAEHQVIPVGEQALIPSGLRMAIPEGYVGLIWPRSGMAAKQGIDRMAGVVDSDYRGEVMISLINHGTRAVEIHTGDRIAQMILQRYEEPLINVVASLDDLEETTRGDGGFGHTGYA